MTVSTSGNRASAACNGVTTAFAYGFRFLADADLKVLLVDDATGAETVLALATDYTVTGAGGASGGTVTTTATYATGNTLVIYGDPEITQGSDYVENDPLPAESLERGFDKGILVAQRLKDRLDRTLRQPDGDADDIGALPAKIVRAGLFLGFDAAGNPVASTGTATPGTGTVADAAVSTSSKLYNRINDQVFATDFFANALAKAAWAADQASYDITSVVQAAIDSIDDGDGGTVTLPRGTLRLTATLTATAEGIVLQGRGRRATRIVADHASGPVIHFKRAYCKATDLRIDASATRQAAGLTGLNFGILVEAEDVPDSTSIRLRHQHVYDVTITGQPSHGIVMVGPVIDGSTIDRARLYSNGGHAIAVERGYLTGRVNKPDPLVPGVVNINNCLAFGNGGHAVAIGHPDDTITTPAVRVVVENVDAGQNATDAAVRYSNHQFWARGSNLELRACTASGDDTGGGAFVAGRNIWIRNFRNVNCTHSVQVGNYAALPTEGVNIEGLTVIGATQDPAVIVDAGASNVRVLNALPSGIASMITPNVPGAEIAVTPQIVQKTVDQDVNNSTALVDDDELKFYLAADEKVYFECLVEHSCPSSSADIQIAFTVPPGAVLRWGPVGGIKVDAASAIVIQDQIAASGTAATFGGTSTKRQIAIQGAVDNGGNAGYLQLQWAQSSAVANNLTVAARTSHLKIWRKY